MALERLKLQKDLAEYDFVRFVFADVHGISRGKYVPTRHVDQFLNPGLGIYSGENTLGARSEINENISPEVTKTRFGNTYVRPSGADSLYPACWACKGKYKVAELLCETYSADGTIQQNCTRYVARKQLQALADLGYTLRSSYECEFMMTNVDTKKFTFEETSVLTTLLFSEFEPFFSDLDAKLISSKIDVETYQTESAPGQYELALRPQDGIFGADQAFRLKEAIKEVAFENGYLVTFMTQPNNIAGNGLHYNHSLWTESGQNAFYDATQPDCLSDVSRWWVAGLIKHSAAITALCCPTVNCYRRLHKPPWAPDKASWGIDDRQACYRVKNLSPTFTYVENRLGAGSANPYLVLAATVAAGVDGIVNRLLLPAEDARDAEVLPRTLEGALDALRDDKVLVESLGREFIEWFSDEKRLIELEKLKASRVSDPEDFEGMESEKTMYFKYM